MSYWDFSRPPAGQDAPGPAGPDDTAYPEGADFPESADFPDGAAYPGAAYPDNTRTPDDPWPADNGWTHDDGAPADDGWPQNDPWPADNGWTRGDTAAADDGWPADDGWTRGDARPAGNGWPGGGLADIGLADMDDDEGPVPYPVTYERAPFTTARSMRAVPPLDDDYEPWPPEPYPGGPGAPGAQENTAVLRDDTAYGGYREQIADSADGRPGFTPRRDSAWPGLREPGVAGPEWPGQVPGEPGDDWGYQGDGRRHGGARRWLIPAAVVVAGAAVGAAAVLLAGGHPNGQASQSAGRPAGPTATPSRPTGRAASSARATRAGAPLTITQAQRVLAGYATVNNQANAQRSDALLATIEAGSSYAIDAGLYQMQRAAGSPAFPPFSPVQAAYYIPRGQPAAGPRWFVVQVGNAFTANPAKVTSAEYLLFTQQTPGGPWLDTIEPYLLAGAGAPQVAVGTDGLATAVGPDSAAVAVAPGQLPAATAAALDGTGLDGADDGQAAVGTPGNLADRADQRTWQAAVPGGQVSDVHAPAAGADGQEFALLTADGGALVFYTDAAQVTVTPPAGVQLQLTVPGFFSSAQALTQARVSYLEQFAVYDPPATDATPGAAGGAPRVVADFSAITGTG